MKLRIFGGILVLMSMLSLSTMYAENVDAKPNGCKGVTLCQAYPELECNDIHFDIGFLYQEMRMTGTGFGYTVSSTYSTLPQDAHMVRPEFKMNWGLTCGIGYHFEHDNWFLKSRFDWLRSEAKKHVTTTWQQHIVPTGVWKVSMIGGSDMTYFKDALSKLKVNYFALETDVNRGSYAGTHLSVEPHAGLKTAWIYFDHKTSYTGGQASYNDLIRNIESDFWGIGPNFGLDTVWNLTEGFSAFCDCGVGLLFGRTRVRDDAKYDTNPTTYHTHAAEKPYVLSPVARGMLGLQFDKKVYHEKQHIMLRVALDVTNYWNQYQHIDVFNENPSPVFKMMENNSFGMVGLMVDFGWDF